MVKIKLITEGIFIMEKLNKTILFVSRYFEDDQETVYTPSSGQNETRMQCH